MTYLTPAPPRKKMLPGIFGKGNPMTTPKGQWYSRGVILLFPPFDHCWPLFFQWLGVTRGSDPTCSLRSQAFECCLTFSTSIRTKRDG